jgi:hypothetical protein
MRFAIEIIPWSWTEAPDWCAQATQRLLDKHLGLITLTVAEARALRRVHQKQAKCRAVRKPAKTRPWLRRMDFVAEMADVPDTWRCVYMPRINTGSERWVFTNAAGQVWVIRLRSDRGGLYFYCFTANAPALCSESADTVMQVPVGVLDTLDSFIRAKIRIRCACPISERGPLREHTPECLEADAQLPDCWVSESPGHWHIPGTGPHYRASLSASQTYKRIGWYATTGTDIPAAGFAPDYKTAAECVAAALQRGKTQ